MWPPTLPAVPILSFTRAQCGHQHSRPFRFSFRHPGERGIPHLPSTVVSSQPVLSVWIQHRRPNMPMRSITQRTAQNRAKVWAPSGVPVAGVSVEGGPRATLYQHSRPHGSVGGHIDDLIPKRFPGGPHSSRTRSGPSKAYAMWPPTLPSGRECW